MDVGAATALVCGLCAGLALALALSACAIAIALAAMPGSKLHITSPRRSPRSMFFVAAAAGALTALAVAAGPSMGAFATGLLSSLPVISGAVAMVEHKACGPRAATHFLRGYVGGLLGKAAFGVAFALLAPRIGATVALLLACACACLLAASKGWRAGCAASRSLE